MCGGFKPRASSVVAGDARLLMRHRLENACFDGTSRLSMDMVEKHNTELMTPAIADQITRRESVVEAPAPLLLNHPVEPYEVEYQIKETKQHIDLNVECEKLSKQKKEGISIRRSSTPFTSEMMLSCRSNSNLSVKYPSPPSSVKYPSPPSSVKYPSPPSPIKTKLLNREKISNMNFDLQKDNGEDPIMYRKFGRKITVGKSLNSAVNTPVEEDLFILNGCKPNKPRSDGTHLNASEAHPGSFVQLPKIKENSSPRQTVQPSPFPFRRNNSVDPVEAVIKGNMPGLFDVPPTSSSLAYFDDSHSAESTTSSSDYNSEEDEDVFEDGYEVPFEKSFIINPRIIPMKEKVNSYLNSIREN